MNETDCQGLVHHIARALKEDLAERLRLSPFLSIIMDGQHEDQLADTVAVYVQFLTGEGAPATEFLSLQRLAGTGAEGYIQAVDRAFSVVGTYVRWCSSLKGSRRLCPGPLCCR